MAKLKSIAARSSSLDSRLARRLDADGHNIDAEPWRAWYWLKRWRDLRWSVFLRDHFTCQCGCCRVEGDTSKLVADHIRPHRGDPALFWDETNVQTLYVTCHSSAKQAAEKSWQAP